MGDGLLDFGGGGGGLMPAFADAYRDRDQIFIHGRIALTPEGGIAVRLTNKTGATSVAGTVVSSSSTTSQAFAKTATADAQPLGVVYEDGIADGALCWVVVAGRCQVLIRDTTTATVGYWVRTSTTVAGRANSETAVPPGGGIPELDVHMREIGHCLETKSAGTDVLVWIILHFN